jgi:hypothetical protein
MMQPMQSGFWKTTLNLVHFLFLSSLVALSQESSQPDTDSLGLVADPLPSEPVIRPITVDTIHLSNGDQLSGNLVQFDFPGITLWDRKDIQTPFAFDSSAIEEIRLGDRPAQQSAWVPSITLRMSNGDQVSGRLEHLSETTLQLATHYGKNLSLPADQIQWAVMHHDDQGILYAGPTGLQGWTMGEVNTAQLEGGQWAYRNGAFYATKAASIARMIGMPDRMQMEFDLEWKGSLNIAVALYTDYLQPVSLAEKDSEPDFGGFYSLQLTSYAVNVLMVKQKEPLQYLGMTQTPVFRQGQRAHVDVRTNKADHSISLLVNGILIKRWVDQGGFAGEGNGIRLVHQGQGSVRLSNLKLKPWDGRFESPPTNRVQSKTDLLTLRNGDKLVGRVSQATQSAVEFMIGETATQTPWERVEKIEWGGVRDTLRPLKQGEARAHLLGGDLLTINLQRIQGHQLHFTSPFYGESALEIRCFERLDFKEQPNIAPQTTNAPKP